LAWWGRKRKLNRNQSSQRIQREGKRQEGEKTRYQTDERILPPKSFFGTRETGGTQKRNNQTHVNDCKGEKKNYRIEKKQEVSFFGTGQGKEKLIGVNVKGTNTAESYDAESERARRGRKEEKYEKHPL